jgi:hypothetical protein
MQDNQITLYSQDLDLEFYHIPKNGMTSVIRGVKGFKWVPLDQIKSTTKTICFLRDPIKRFVSAFEHFVWYEGSSPFIEGQSVRRLDEREQRMLGRGNFTVEGLNNFIRVIEKGGFFNNHHLKQIHYLDGSNGPLSSDGKISHRSIDKIDHFYPLKNIPQTFKENHGLKLANNRDIVMNEGLGSKKAKSEILEFVRMEKTNILRELYREDFELYEKYINQ